MNLEKPRRSEKIIHRQIPLHNLHIPLQSPQQDTEHKTEARQDETGTSKRHEGNGRNQSTTTVHSGSGTVSVTDDNIRCIEDKPDNFNLPGQQAMQTVGSSIDRYGDEIIVTSDENLQQRRPVHDSSSVPRSSRHLQSAVDRTLCSDTAQKSCSRTVEKPGDSMQCFLSAVTDANARLAEQLSQQIDAQSRTISDGFAEMLSAINRQRMPLDTSRADIGPSEDTKTGKVRRNVENVLRRQSESELEQLRNIQEAFCRLECDMRVNAEKEATTRRQERVDSQQSVVQLKRELDLKAAELEHYKVVARSTIGRQTQESCVNETRNCCCGHDVMSDEPAANEASIPEHVSKLHQLFIPLAEQLEAKTVADVMFQSDALTRKELELIQTSRSTTESAEILLNVLLKAPREVFECFLRALRNTNQEHVFVQLQCPDTNADNIHGDLIRHNYLFLLDTLDTKYSCLTAQLYEEDVLCVREKEDVEAELTSTRQNEKLLSILSRKSTEQFRRFLDALDRTGQSHIKDRITDNKRDSGVESVRLLSTMSLSRVEGIASCDDKLFVALHSSDTIQVYGGARNERLADIRIDGLKEPWDMVACGETKQLYVADGSLDLPARIWRLSLDGRQVIKWFPRNSPNGIDEFSPDALSMTSRRLLVTSFVEDEVLLFGPEGAELSRVQLCPCGLGKVRHAIETRRGTFAVSHLKPHPQVTELDAADGTVVGVYCPLEPFASPVYLSLDASDRLYVADRDRHRVTVFNSRHEAGQMLLDSEHDELTTFPSRMCYVEATGRLLISSWKSFSVQEFELRIAK